MMSDDRIAVLYATYEHGTQIWNRHVVECLDEIRRLRRQLDAATTDRDAWESKARSLAAQCGYANPDYLEANDGDDD